MNSNRMYVLFNLSFGLFLISRYSNCFIKSFTYVINYVILIFHWCNCLARFHRSSNERCRFSASKSNCNFVSFLFSDRFSSRLFNGRAKVYERGWYDAQRFAKKKEKKQKKDSPEILIFRLMKVQFTPGRYKSSFSLRFRPSARTKVTRS